MNPDVPQATVRTTRHPILRILISFPIACFSAALITDLAYAFTADMMWADFSTWLLAGGIIVSVFAAIGGIIDFIANRGLRTQRQIWPVFIGSLLVLILALFDNLVHSRDAWTSVVPFGLLLSAVTVIVTLITVWYSSAIRDREIVRYAGAPR